ncbi:hypothetical protein MKK63_00630 [Methylobacterium sp. J-088]|uniref:hypothetical protein n=1 Tax=Methylobacterium sp. J-088 TaxID=2836664 RepID=UPI001FB9FE78|nr:hypothetical protein [Methylobacterium sp. J-088]MCJ2061224.1 hypothetical protein [Methylobacterium sp. J-088]
MEAADARFPVNVYRDVAPRPVIESGRHVSKIVGLCACGGTEAHLIKHWSRDRSFERPMACGGRF